MLTMDLTQTKKAPRLKMGARGDDAFMNARIGKDKSCGMFSVVSKKIFFVKTEKTCRNLACKKMISEYRLAKII